MMDLLMIPNDSLLWQPNADQPVLMGLPAYHIQRLQSIMNALAWLIFGFHRSDRIIDALVSLQLL